MELERRKPKKLDDDTVALLHKLRTASRVNMLSGARKKNLVLGQKSHIGEVKSLL